MKLEFPDETEYWMDHEEWKAQEEWFRKRESELVEYTRNGFRTEIIGITPDQKKAGKDPANYMNFENKILNKNNIMNISKELDNVSEMNSNEKKEMNNLVEKLEDNYNPENQSEFDIMSAKYIDAKTPYSFAKSALVKPLEIKKIKVMEEEPIDTGKVDKETGAKIYEGTKMVEKEVDSPFIEGIIISMPTHKEFSGGFDYTLGQHIIYPKNKSMEFHLLNDTVLLNPYDIVATVKPEHVKALEKPVEETLDDRSKKANLDKLNKK